MKYCFALVFPLAICACSASDDGDDCIDSINNIYANVIGFNDPKHMVLGDLSPGGQNGQRELVIAGESANAEDYVLLVEAQTDMHSLPDTSQLASDLSNKSDSSCISGTRVFAAQGIRDINFTSTAIFGAAGLPASSLNEYVDVVFYNSIINGFIPPRVNFEADKQSLKEFLESNPKLPLVLYLRPRIELLNADNHIFSIQYFLDDENVISTNSTPISIE